MDALLILTGMVLTLVAWVWLASLAWRQSVGVFVLALLLPWLTLFLRGFKLLPRLLLVIGLVAAGSGLYLLQRDQPERFAALISGQWMATPEASVQGQMLGQAFNPERVYWQGQTLIFEERSGERLRRALSLEFSQVPMLLEDSLIERLPGDQGGWPELVLQWHAGALEAPGLRRIADEYSLSLQFIPDPGQQSAQVRIHLHLPVSHATWLTGEATLVPVPDWLRQLGQQARQPAPEPAAAEFAQSARPAPTGRTWQPFSVLGLVDEPDPFLGQPLRLTTWSGRVYEGRLREVSESRRLVLALPQGPNQVDLHFHPLDVRSLEVLSNP